MREAIAAEPDRYFQRRMVPRTESQLKEFLEDAWAQGRSMRDDHLAERSPRNPEACHAYGTCPFWLVCSTGSRPEDHIGFYHRRDWSHPELTPEVAA